MARLSDVQGEGVSKKVSERQKGNGAGDYSAEKNPHHIRNRPELAVIGLYRVFMLWLSNSISKA